MTKGSGETGFTKRWSGWERALARHNRWRFGLYRTLPFAITYMVVQVLLNRLNHKLDTWELVVIAGSLLVVGIPLNATLGRWMFLGRDGRDGDRWSHRPDPFDPFS